MNDTATIPVPQADDINKVFKAVELVADGHTTAADIADALKLVPRQGFYYTAAAEQIGLIERNETTHEFTLTRQGRYYVAAEGDQRVSLRRQAVLRSPILQYIAAQIGIYRLRYPPPEQLQDTAFLQDCIERLGFAEETALRRAYTIRSWLKDM